MMTKDQVEAKRFLEQQIERKNAEFARNKIRIEWQNKAGAFAMKKMAEFHQNGEFGAEAARKAGRKARIEFEAMHGPCPPTEYQFVLRRN